MIFTSTDYFARKEKIKSVKNWIKNQIVKLAILVLVCVLTASLIQKSYGQTSYTFYVAQKKIVNKHTRGVFPPLQGSYYNMIGCWQIVAKIGQSSMDINNFKNYSICFKQGYRMSVNKIKPFCSGSLNALFYRWNIYSYNLFISQQSTRLKGTKMQDSSQENQTLNSGLEKYENLKQNEPVQETPQNNREGSEQNINQLGLVSLNSTQIQPEKTICFEQDQIIFQYIRSFTVWTLRDRNLYLISQAVIKDNLDVSIFVLAPLQ